MDGKLEASALLMLTETSRVMGTESNSQDGHSPNTDYSVLEYLSREDADAAVKALDNKELRGNVVRVALGGEV